MQLVLNGKGIEIDHEMKLADFLDMKGLEPGRIVIEYNFNIIKREEWDKVVLKENDNLEVLRFMGGGQLERLVWKANRICLFAPITEANIWQAQ